MRVQVGDVRLWFDVAGAQLIVDESYVHKPVDLGAPGFDVGAYLDSAGLVERPTVLLLHGGPYCDHTVFKPFFDELADTAQLVYLDQRGQGRSDRGDPSDWRLDVWADDVRRFCDAVGIDGPIVLGWSFGGTVALHYAARHPGHPAGLILQSPLIPDLDLIAEGFRRLGGDDAADAALAYWSGVGDLPTLLDYAARCAPLYGQSATGADVVGRHRINLELLLNPGASVRGVDLLTPAAGITCPTLVVAGEDDPVSPIEAAEALYASLPTPTSRLERFSKAGHAVHGDDPQRFFGLIREFITA